MAIKARTKRGHAPSRSPKHMRLPDGIQRPKSIVKLKSLLRLHDVSFGAWGEGYTRTLRELLAEVHCGESVLIVRDGKLIRQVHHAQADIVCHTSQGLLRLIEVRQEFANGAVRHRSRDALRSVSEKIRRNENARAAIIRGIQEELGLMDFSGGGLMANCMKRGKRMSESAESYPTLSVEHVFSVFDWEMPLAYFVAEGYVEVQPRKRTYFAWEPA